MLAHNTARKPGAEAGTGSPLPAQPTKKAPAREHVVDSRFGTLRISVEDVLHLPNGLLGFAGFQDFGLAALPDGKHPQFRVLQCLSEHDLAFLVAPLNLESGAIDDADLAEACATLGVPRDRVGVLLIVTVRRDEEGAHVSVNMRAPLFVDLGQNIARQYVMPNNRYSIRHAL